MIITIEETEKKHEVAFIEAVQRSRTLHQNWVTPPSTPEMYSEHLRKFASENNASFLALSESKDLVGCINLSEIVRGSFQSAYLGFFAFEPFQGKGHMKVALSAVVSQAFEHLGLHRLEANIQASNTASVGLVESLGFRLEGFSPRYLELGGEWQDHQRYAITVEEWTPNSNAAQPIDAADAKDSHH